MASRNNDDHHYHSPPIPLQDFSRGREGGGEGPPRPPHITVDTGSEESSPVHHHHQHGARSLLPELGRRLSTSIRGTSPGASPYSPGGGPFSQSGDLETEVPIEQYREGLDEALGLTQQTGGRPRRGSWLPPRNLGNVGVPQAVNSDDDVTTYGMGARAPYVEDAEEDMQGLTSPQNMAPMAGSPLNTRAGRSPRPSSQSVRFASRSPGARLGDDLERGSTGGHGRRPSVSKMKSLAPPGASPVRRLSVAVQSMSQRVVNLGNDPAPPLSRKSSQSSQRTVDLNNESIYGESEYRRDEEDSPSTPDEKPSTPLRPVHPSIRLGPNGKPNPLRGHSLKIFGPNNPLRLGLCDILVHPATEPLILVFIIIQLIFLTVDSASSVFEDPRDKPWGTSASDYGLLILFIVYTLEIIAHCIVSGFVNNPHDPAKPRVSLRRRVIEQSSDLFSPTKKPSIRRKPSEPLPPSLLRSITHFQMTDADVPRTAADQRRYRLASHAFLRHSFNRLDFVAVVSYWISLALTLMEIETNGHIYVFRMMSCLRILRLLGITSGTSVILRSLKKAAPLLVNVALLIGFFWLIFAVVGVQSFKSSLRRHCVWVDPLAQQPNVTSEFQFCGGHMDATGKRYPWVYPDGRPGAKSPKGFTCPINSFCVLGDNPYGGTVSFDNVLQSLELVFVIMSSNTFSELIYYTADSDYLIGSVFFIVGVVILAFWLVNLLVAVITTSFQIIREETKKSAFTEKTEDEGMHIDHEVPPIRQSGIKRFYDRTFWLWILVISIGLFAQSFRSATMSARKERIIDNFEFVVTLLLDLEIGLRFASNWRNFHRLRRNWTDLIIAIMTTLLLLPPIRNSARVYAWLTIFQIIRVYRVVWAIPATRNLLAKVLGNVSGLLNLLFFVILLTYLCAIFAVQLVRGDLPQFDDEGEVSPISFFTIWYAFLGMYQIFSSEGWTSILYEAQMSQKEFGVGWISAIFFIGWFILANFVVLNMFIAVIQENFDVSEDEKRMYQVKAFLERKEIGAAKKFSFRQVFSRGGDRDPTEYNRAAVQMLTKEAVVDSFLDERTPNRMVRAPALVTKTQHIPKWKQLFNSLWRDREPNPFYSKVAPRSVGDLALTAMAQEAVAAEAAQKKAQREYLQRHPNYNVTLGIFRDGNKIRRMCQMLVAPSRGNVRFGGKPPSTGPWLVFSAITYSCIIAMVILACVTTPLYQKEYFDRKGFSITNWFVLTDAGFAGFFTVEAIIKVIADGLVNTPNAYLRGPWGVIDSIVLITLWISVIAALRDQGDVSRAVGAFKALRALRLLNISGSARDIFQSVVLKGGRTIISASFVSLSLIIPFAIYGVNLFAGLLDECNDGSGITDLAECVHEYKSSPFEWEVLAPRVVVNPYVNFDNFGSSLFILFQIVSQEGWTAVSWNVQKIVGKGKQPQALSAPGNALFFVTFNLLGAVFVLTLFVSVFMRNYTEQTGVAFLTSEQRSWLELRKLLRQIRPSKRPPTSPNESWKSWCYRQATNKKGRWQRFMTVILLLHTFLLVIEYYPAPAGLDRVRDMFFLAFTIIYIVNVVVRIIGLTLPRYIRSRWDLYSLVCTSGTLASTVLLLAHVESPIFERMQKLFLVSLVFLLIPRNNQLDHLFKTAAASFRTIGSLIATWFVLFLVYAIALTQTFGLTRIGANGNGNLNFRTVPKALIVLFRMSCGEGWNDIMSDFEIKEPFCVKSSNFLESDCGSEVYARLLFVSWNIISMYIFVSLFVSLIFESFSYVYQRSGNLSAVSRDEMRRFKDAWLQFDPTGTGYIPVEKFPRLLGKLKGVFAMRIYDEKHSIKSILDDVRTDLPDGKGIVAGVDIDALNQRLATLPIHKVRRQRHVFNLFYEEVMVTADKENGVAFTSVLLILAHYKIIDDTKSLKLEEFLRRRWRMQKVEDQVRRNTVTDFFLTLYWHKRFKLKQTTASASNPFSFSSPFSAKSPFSSASKSPFVPEIRVEADQTDGPSTSTPSTNPFRLSGTIPRIQVDDGGISPGTQPAATSPTGRSTNPFDVFLSGGTPRTPEASPPNSARNSRASSPSRTPPGSPSHLPTRTGTVSVQSVLEEALDQSEWGPQIRSVASQLSPSSPGFGSRSGSPTGTGSPGSRSPARSPARSTSGNSRGTRSRSGSTAQGSLTPGFLSRTFSRRERRSRDGDEGGGEGAYQQLP